jgi:amidohydrolase
MLIGDPMSGIRGRSKMAKIEAGSELHRAMTAWRRHLHAHPETAFEEHDTAAFVAERLAELEGVTVETGIAGTGVVGTLVTGPGPSIGLRADMDALGFQEANDFAYRSTRPGKMHACGHDGHTAMLLGAARYLAESRCFRGTVRFIFQPAEENEAGGRVMVEDGLFSRFPVDTVYGLHNWPGLPVGRMALAAGPMMASCDLFEIELTGRGCHAAMPHLGSDTVLAAAAVTIALHGLVGRMIDAQDAAVLSVTQAHAGETWNVLPERAVLRGTVRAFRESVQSTLEAAITETARSIAAAHRCSAEMRYERRYPATVNDPDATRRAARAAALAIGDASVEHAPRPSMGSEDFAFMLRERPGCYVWLGNGPIDGGRVLHNPHYDFNDAILPIGALWWATLVESELPKD